MIEYASMLESKGFTTDGISDINKWMLVQHSEKPCVFFGGLVLCTRVGDRFPAFKTNLTYKRGIWYFPNTHYTGMYSEILCYLFCLLTGQFDNIEIASGTHKRTFTMLFDIDEIYTDFTRVNGSDGALDLIYQTLCKSETFSPDDFMDCIANTMHRRTYECFYRFDDSVNQSVEDDFGIIDLARWKYYKDAIKNRRKKAKLEFDRSDVKTILPSVPNVEDH